MDKKTIKNRLKNQVYVFFINFSIIKKTRSAERAFFDMNLLNFAGGYDVNAGGLSAYNLVTLHLNVGNFGVQQESGTDDQYISLQHKNLQYSDL